MSKITILRMLILFLIGVGLFEGMCSAFRKVEQRHLKLRKKNSFREIGVNKITIIIIYITLLGLYIGVLLWVI